MSQARSDRILTLHPAGKQGVRIERAKYAAMRTALERVVPTRGPGVPFGELSELVRPLLPREVFGPDVSVTWYVTTVKQDLEARGVLEQVAGARPQRLLRKAARRRPARKGAHA